MQLKWIESYNSIYPIIPRVFSEAMNDYTEYNQPQTLFSRVQGDTMVLFLKSIPTTIYDP